VELGGGIFTPPNTTKIKIWEQSLSE